MCSKLLRWSNFSRRSKRYTPIHLNVPFFVRNEAYLSIFFKTLLHRKNYGHKPSLIPSKIIIAPPKQTFLTAFFFCPSVRLSDRTTARLESCNEPLSSTREKINSAPEASETIIPTRIVQLGSMTPLRPDGNLCCVLLHSIL